MCVVMSNNDVCYMPIKEEPFVGHTGFEPVTSCVSYKYARLLRQWPIEGCPNKEHTKYILKEYREKVKEKRTIKFNDILIGLSPDHRR